MTNFDPYRSRALNSLQFIICNLPFVTAPIPYAAAQQPCILGRLETLKDLDGKGLSAAVYTQLSDVENEVNGFLTYDRTTVQKVSPEAIQRAVRKLYAP